MRTKGMLLAALSVLVVTTSGQEAQSTPQLEREGTAVLDPWGPDAGAPTRAPALGNEVTISAYDNEEYLPAVAYNSMRDEYLVVWHNVWSIGTRDIRAQRVSAQGALLGSTFTVFEHATKDAAQPSVAYDPVRDRYLVVFIFDVFGNGSDWDVYGRFIPWSGPSPGLSEFFITGAVDSQWEPVVVHNRHSSWQEFLVVWTTTPSVGKAFLSGQRILADASGVPSPCCLDIAQHATENRVHPDLAYNLARNEYLVVYDNAGDVLGKRLQANGTGIGGLSAEFVIAGWPDPEEKPAVAACASDNQYLVGWESLNAGGPDLDVYARYVAGTGAVQEVFPVFNTSGHERRPAIACSAYGQYLVVSETQYAGGSYGVWGRMAYPNKTRRAAFAMDYVPGSTRTTPAIASGPYGFFSAWEHLRFNTSYQEIHGRAYSPLIFADGFESGNTLAWSGSIP